MIDPMMREVYELESIADALERVLFSQKRAK